MNELETTRALGRTMPDADEAGTRRVRSALLEAIEAERSSGTPRRAKRRRPLYRRPRLLAAVAAVVVGLFALGVVLPLREGGSPPASADVFDRLARTAARPLFTPAPGQFVYLKSRSADAAVYVTDEGTKTRRLPTSTRRIWMRADGSTLEIEGAGKKTYHFPPVHSPRWKNVPRDPAALDRAFRLGTHGLPRLRTDEVLFKDATSDLSELDTPPSVRAALFHVIAAFPDVHVLGAVTDRLGRRGVGVVFREGDTSERVIFDLETAFPLDVEYNTPRFDDGGGTSHGHVHGWAVYSTPIVVDRLRSTESVQPSTGP